MWNCRRMPMVAPLHVTHTVDFSGAYCMSFFPYGCLESLLVAVGTLSLYRSDILAWNWLGFSEGLPFLSCILRQASFCFSRFFQVTLWACIAI